MNGLKYSPLFRSTVGFEDLVSMLDNVTRNAAPSTYPPYNIERLDENDYRISIAVAGFSEDELEIEARQNELWVSGKRNEPENTNYLYQGIAARSFRHRFHLADHVKVEDAKLENGLLHIELKREIPEEMKPRQISITRGSPAKSVEHGGSTPQGSPAQTQGIPNALAAD